MIIKRVKVSSTQKKSVDIVFCNKFHTFTDSIAVRIKVIIDIKNEEIMTSGKYLYFLTV